MGGTDSLTVAHLKDVLDYDPETGTFRWKYRAEWNNQLNSKLAGKEAGCEVRQGPITYIVIRIDKVLYRAHRLAWLWVHGRFPEKYIDHCDGVGTNNRAANLREVDDVANGANSAMKSNNTTGITGVVFFKRDRNYLASVSHRRQHYHLGYFKTKEEAGVAVLRKRAELGISPTHGLTRELRKALGPSAVQTA